MEVIRSNKGSLKLCYEGFSYTKQKSSKTTTRWECSKKRASTCKGAVTTNLNVSISFKLFSLSLLSYLVMLIIMA